jgi:hypothetical protein
MRPVDSGAFLVTAFGVLMVNAVAAVVIGCSLYAAHGLYRRHVRPSPRIPEIAAGMAD